MGIKFNDEKTGLAKIWEDIGIWWYIHFTSPYRSIRCWFRICCNKRHFRLAKQALFHTYPFDYEFLYELQKFQLEEQIEYYKHSGIAVPETYEPIVRWQKMAIKLHDIMLDHNVELYDYTGDMEFVPTGDGNYRLKDDDVEYHCLVKVNMRNLDRYLQLSHNHKYRSFYIEHPHELYQLKAWYLYHKLLAYYAQSWWD